jgi:hypothetical protein
MAIVFNLDKLKQVEAQLKKEVSVKVGVLGSKNNRTQTSNYSYDNAGVGLKHEFGKFAPEIGKRMPIRSFLRMPLQTRYKKTLESKNWFSKDEFEKFIDPNENIKFYRKFGTIAQRIIDDAFKTSGFGTWKLSRMEFKKVHQTLVESNQLRRAITFEVIRK